MKPKPDVRIADIEDFDDVWEMRKRFFDDQVARGLLDIPTEVEKTLRRTTLLALKKERSLLLLCRIDGSAAGYLLLANKIVPTQTLPRIWSIEELYVEPGHRCLQVGSALTENALAHAREGRADRVQLRVLARNAGGHGFWASQGFEPALTLYELKT